MTVAQRPTEDVLARLNGGDQPDGQDAPSQGGQAAPQQALGLGLTPLTPELATRGNLPPDARGVMVTSVDPNSDAAERGLQRGDLVISVNNQPVTAPAQVLAVVEQARRSGRTGVVLLVRRGRGPEQFIGVDIAPN